MTNEQIVKLPAFKWASVAAAPPNCPRPILSYVYVSRTHVRAADGYRARYAPINAVTRRYAPLLIRKDGAKPGRGILRTHYPIFENIATEEFVRGTFNITPALIRLLAPLLHDHIKQWNAATRKLDKDSRPAPTIFIESAQGDKMMMIRTCAKMGSVSVDESDTLISDAEPHEKPWRVAIAAEFLRDAIKGVKTDLRCLVSGEQQPIKLWHPDSRYELIMPVMTTAWDA